MKKNIVAILLIVTLALTGCSSSSEGTSQRGSENDNATDSEGRVYTSDFDPDTNQTIDFYEIEFQVPADWKEGDNTNDGTLVFSMTDGSMSVSGGNSSGNHDLTSEEEQDTIIKSIDTGGSFEENSRKTTTILEDITALYFTTTQDLSDIPVNMYVLAFVTDDRLYMLGVADRQDSEYNHSKDFDKIIDSITWTVEDEESTEPVDDFFSDEERQNEYETLYKSYQFSELYNYVKAYIDNGGDSILESDSAYIILDLLDPILETEGTWTVNFDDFDSSYSVSFNGANEISDSESISISLSGSELGQTIGFRKSGWLFFDKYALSIDGEVVDSGNVKSTSRNEDVISGSTIEESYSASNIFDDDVCEQLKDAENAVLRFENSSENENYDHTLTHDEKYALYASNLIRDNWVELSNLIYRYRNGIEYKSLKDY